MDLPKSILLEPPGEILDPPEPLFKPPGIDFGFPAEVKTFDFAILYIEFESFFLTLKTWEAKNGKRECLEICLIRKEEAKSREREREIERLIERDRGMWGGGSGHSTALLPDQRSDS